MSIFRTFSSASSRPFFTPPITGVNGSNYWEQIGQLPAPGYGRTGVWIDSDATKAYATQPTGYPEYGAAVLYNRNGSLWTQSGGNLTSAIGTANTTSDGRRVSYYTAGDFGVWTNTDGTWSQRSIDNDGARSAGYHCLSDDGNTLFFHTTRLGNFHNGVYRWNGTTWAQILYWIDGAGQYPTFGGYVNVAISGDGQILGISGVSGLYVYTSGGVQVGGTITAQTPGTIRASFLSQNGTRLAFLVDKNNQYTECVYEVYDFNGTSWQMVGSPVSSGSGVSWQSVGGRWINSDCTIFAVCRSLPNNQRAVQFYKYNGTSWATLGSAIQGDIGVYLRLTSNGSKVIVSGTPAAPSETARIYQYIS